MIEQCIMKELKYIGIEKPSSILEIKVEISGLEHVIAQAQEMICRLNQSIAMVELKKNNTFEEKTK